MVDFIASIVIVVGSVLMMLGAIGLLRFPDVFTRMHAATKTATVGVIAITGAAAIEAGAVGGTLVLLLVVGLLFLTGPLGMSMLARAAYHDPETPRSPKTREVAVVSRAATAAVVRAGRGTNRALVVWLWLVWVALFGSLRIPVLVGGAVAAVVIASVLRLVAPGWPRYTVRPIAALRFLLLFLKQLAVATWQVMRLVGQDPAELRPAVILVPLATSSRSVTTLLANAVSFTPGTIALEILDQSLVLHALDIEDPDLEVAAVQEMEAAIMAAFGARHRQFSNDSLNT